MLFLEKFKNKVNQLFDVLSSSINKLKDRIFTHTSDSFDPNSLRIHNHQDFSYAFVDIDKINLLSKEFQSLLNYIIDSIKKHLLFNNSILINIITKIILKDKLNIIYTHSLTYKLLFTLNDLDKWKNLIDKDITELLNQYNDSSIIKIEFRFDYIGTESLNKTLNK